MSRNNPHQNNTQKRSQESNDRCENGKNAFENSFSKLKEAYFKRKYKVLLDCANISLLVST